MDVAVRRPGGRTMQELLSRAGVAYMDVGKGREQERKLEGD
jgi:hypothetical protein